VCSNKLKGHCSTPRKIMAIAVGIWALGNWEYRYREWKPCGSGTVATYLVLRQELNSLGGYLAERF